MRSAGSAWGEARADARRHGLDRRAPAAARPRHFMGIGDPEGILRAIGSGVDMFDCVLLMRLGLHGLGDDVGGAPQPAEPALRPRRRARSGRLPLPRMHALLARLHPSPGHEDELLGLRPLTLDNISLPARSPPRGASCDRRSRASGTSRTWRLSVWPGTAQRAHGQRGAASRARRRSWPSDRSAWWPPTPGHVHLAGGGAWWRSSASRSARLSSGDEFVAGRRRIDGTIVGLDRDEGGSRSRPTSWSAPSAGTAVAARVVFMPYE